MRPVTNIDNVKIKLSIPTGLPFVSGSGSTGNLSSALNTNDVEFVESTKVFRFNGPNNGSGYTSAADTKLFEFQCTVDASAAGSLSIGMNIEEDEFLKRAEIIRISHSIKRNAPCRPTSQ